MNILIYLFIILFGLAIGSFLNVLIFRLPEDQSKWARVKRSVCRACNKVLKPLELIPVVSFLIQKGRCRSCNEKLSWQYPAVEITAAAIFLLLTFIHLPFGAVISETSVIFLIRDFFIASILILVFTIDVKHFLILNKVIYPALVVVALFNLYLLDFDLKKILGIIIGALIGFSFFAFQYFFSKGKWVGGGDMKFGAFIGLALGWQGMVTVLVLAYIVGALFAIALLISGKAKFGAKLPMAAFLAPAALLILLYGEYIWSWYFNLMI
ncbi:prepilin peptidase [Candidatus Falkowbacteria bacterium CG10_big_fil_rev_8_21_14_0_10_39_11]|uniref:Prepilin peptidase n=1 Tax=Candidatus Falkowbacteria bacterium CG10_big_fil_rev_8_21_14_0_10_39_11 TaxID=1974565 RepID=A0A2H0V6E2_9BACT|nr:MAG: prepilin peptidase [Candidatus Falkowbacteria bacterium CG10_big_fil_rev_8_21_14_0_10_39_11]